METPLQKYFQYCDFDIDGWDLMAWAVQMDTDLIEDKEALKELIELDDFYANGFHEHVENLVHRTIPQKERKCKGELYIDAAHQKLKNGLMSSAEFVSTFVKIYLHEIDFGNNPIVPECSDWLHNFFNENNGFGFYTLEEMSSSELLEYIQEKIEEDQSTI